MKTVLMVAAGMAVGLTVVVAVVVQILVQLAPILVAAAVAAVVLQLVRSRRQRPNVHVVPAAPWVAPYSAPAPQPLPAPHSAALPTAGAAVEDLYLRWGPSTSESPDSVPTFTPRTALPPGRRARAGSRPAGSDRGRRP
ncbi:hypothetical protein [Mycolicibacterium goodii]|uniref:hypothetical protein n=1 Tax=Mycolicibacterium goodii TaxID=134601 RepID=UPI001BDD6871|nr:hypothetical protein [Mycolicibacterium goodii]MBU8841272.1 hypothetical protein [Mycolicibacterium goodii]